ncbi:AraC family transcriptional regulator [Streptomyces sp. DG2A-72]|uniref:cupin domain-containing protein n=1 Tax=Streptomyces sp. DG2A-72 TaxID=3051386 RepID=UPI00265BB9C7|nr:AraC family transcriptional regulator [Streptomyces sp. DG2A-72]MDO0933312.1 AraC family transcriptional regulator [Streptomyces sp. DG2A-72]
MPSTTRGLPEGLHGLSGILRPARALMQEFTTEVVPAAERFDLWQDISARTYMPHLLRTDCRDDFRATLRTLPLGDVQISSVAFEHLVSVRTTRLIRRKGVVAQDGHDRAFRAGDLLFIDSSLPYESWHRMSSDTASTVIVAMPRTVLPLPPRTVRRLLAPPIPLDRGLGGVLYRWLADIAARADEFTEADVPTLASVTTDLLASVFGDCPDAEDALTPEARRRALHTRIRDFIDQNLGDPSLSPAGVAAAHGISVRHRRLERCRRDLADPRLRARSIQTVAARRTRIPHRSMRESSRSVHSRPRIRALCLDILLHGGSGYGGSLPVSARQ